MLELAFESDQIGQDSENDSFRKNADPNAEYLTEEMKEASPFVLFIDKFLGFLIYALRNRKSKPWSMTITFWRRG